MFAQLCVYCGAIAQAHATVAGITTFPTYKIRYYQQNSNAEVVVAGADAGDCMCLDYCVAALMLLAVLDVALDFVHFLFAVVRWVVTSVKAPIPFHLSTSTLPLRAMVTITMLAVHPVACAMLIVLMVVAFKTSRVISIIVYRPAVHLPHPTFERLLQVACGLYP